MVDFDLLRQYSLVTLFIVDTRVLFDLPMSNGVNERKIFQRGSVSPGGLWTSRTRDSSSKFVTIST